MPVLVEKRRVDSAADGFMQGGAVGGATPRSSARPAPTWVVVGSGFVWLLLLIGFTMSDLLTRTILG
jgi:hypothetical protein